MLPSYNNNKLQGGAGKAKNDCARKKNYFSTNHNSSNFQKGLNLEKADKI